ncbi:hypothetical protein BJY04DRAFT_27784 [Aspergillus karnatakaensis]|uniref:uncharacterized protein n=1 Tax=Aspergillus karnatakaensis TaxID=1810916 RepID=UPI003CCE0561
MAAVQDHITALPDELLHDIVASIADINEPHPLSDSDQKTPSLGTQSTLNNLRALALTSRRFYPIAQQVLYHTFCLCDHSRRRKFFRTIVEKPSLAKHVRNVFFTPTFYQLSREPPPTDLQCFRRALHELGPLSPELSLQWYRRIRQGNPALELICLLVRLENLQRFQLVALDPELKEHFVIFLNTLHWYINHHQVGDILTRLEELYVDIQDTSVVSATRALLPLRNLRKMYLSGPSDNAAAKRDYQKEFSARNIRDLSCISSKLSVDALKFLLLQVEGLESLHYDYSTIRQSPTGDFLSVLQPHKQSLKSLRVTAQFDQWDRIATSFATQQPWSFEDFPVLAHIEVPDFALVGIEGTNTYAHGFCTLPPRLKSLTSTACLYEEKTLQFLIDVASDRASFPALSEITFRGRTHDKIHLNTMVARLGTVCASRGIAFAHRETVYTSTTNCPACEDYGCWDCMP